MWGAANRFLNNLEEGQPREDPNEGVRGLNWDGESWWPGVGQLNVSINGVEENGRAVFSDGCHRPLASTGGVGTGAEMYFIGACHWSGKSCHNAIDCEVNAV